MKNKLKLTTTIIALIASPFAFAADDHDHSGETKEKHAAHGKENHGKKGPNGGQVVESKAGFMFEVAVDKQRMARIVFLDQVFKAVTLAEQSITGIAGERSAPVKLTFARGKDADANVLISDKPLPAGAHIPMILMIKPASDAKAVAERFELHIH
jgi:hypothetical protein